MDGENQEITSVIKLSDIMNIAFGTVSFIKKEGIPREAHRNAEEMASAMISGYENDPLRTFECALSTFLASVVVFKFITDSDAGDKSVGASCTTH